MNQELALDILKTGVNVFLTGEPGSGKSHTVSEYVRYLRANGDEAAVTAATGIAATHINGQTIHSWSGIGIKDSLSGRDLEDIAGKAHVAKRVSRCRVLIIDEVSMLGPDILNMVDMVCKAVRKSQQPFGGLQVVLVGDFFQLPPVVRRNALAGRQAALAMEPAAVFAYQAAAWQMAEPVVCYLTDQYRQDDAAFLDLLSSIRKGELDDSHGEQIRSRMAGANNLPINTPKLYTHNLDVDKVNAVALAKLGGRQYSFAMRATGAKPLVEAIKKGCLSPERLALADGAAVMFTKNNPQAGFVNGTLGTVRGLDRETGYPLVLTKTGKTICVEPAEWTIEDRGKVQARVNQIPLRLAWAITVHKSQGMSLDAAIMDLSGVFEYGQGYVALSRVRRLAGVHLLGVNNRAFLVHPQVLAADADFRLRSDAAETVYRRPAKKRRPTRPAKRAAKKRVPKK